MKPNKILIFIRHIKFGCTKLVNPLWCTACYRQGKNTFTITGKWDMEFWELMKTYYEFSDEIIYMW